MGFHMSYDATRKLTLGDKGEGDLGATSASVLFVRCRENMETRTVYKLSLRKYRRRCSAIRYVKGV